MGTGTEGDVEARCFSKLSPPFPLPFSVLTRNNSRTRLATRSTHSHIFLTRCLRSPPLCSHKIAVCIEITYCADLNRLQKAIEARGRPTDLRQWSEVRSITLENPPLSFIFRLYSLHRSILSPIQFLIVYPVGYGMKVFLEGQRCVMPVQAEAMLRLVLAVEDACILATSLNGFV